MIYGNLFDETLLSIQMEMEEYGFVVLYIYIDNKSVNKFPNKQRTRLRTIVADITSGPSMILRVNTQRRRRSVLLPQRGEHLVHHPERLVCGDASSRQRVSTQSPSSSSLCATTASLSSGNAPAALSAGVMLPGPT